MSHRYPITILIGFSLAILASSLPINAALAVPTTSQSSAQALTTGSSWAYAGNFIDGVRGARADIIVPQPPSTSYSYQIYNVVCRQATGYACNSYYQAKVYIDYYQGWKATASVTDGAGHVYLVVLGNVAIGSWHSYKVMYSNTSTKWEAWIDNQPMWQMSGGTAWTSGNMVVYGFSDTVNTAVNDEKVFGNPQTVVGTQGWQPFYRSFYSYWGYPYQVNTAYFDNDFVWQSQ